MKGAFTCPHCMTQNACDCETCKPFIKEGEPVNKWDETGNILICGKCGKSYTPDQSLDAEFKLNKMTQETMTKEQILEKHAGGERMTFVYSSEALFAMEEYAQQQLSAERERAGKLVKVLQHLDFAIDVAALSNAVYAIETADRNLIKQTLNEYDTATKEI